MSEKSSSGIGKSILSAVIVAAIVLPLGYVGFDFMRKEMREHHTETRSVVMDLKSVAVEEIRSSTTKTAEALQNVQPGGGGNSQALAAEMTSLKQVTEQILAEQKTISESLSKVLKMETEIAKAKPAPEGPVADFSETVYFGIGKASGADVDKRIAALVPKMKTMLAASGPCQIDVTGFADTLGGDLSNLKLSRARADYVAGKLRKAELDVYSVEAWGERRLKVHTYDGVKNENNRRADIEMHCGKKPKKATAGT
ncbi:MAG: hypothetical protein JJ900_11010 [Rhodospirillales bacterium]|nr:hypothetical protein [Rhodospirillales bacterium]MBO6787369.1 hypothetical protein [Rhodospirillales bacterium]